MSRQHHLMKYNLIPANFRQKSHLCTNNLCQLVRVHGVNLIHVELHVKICRRPVARLVALERDIHRLEHVLPARRLAEYGPDGDAQLGPR